MSSALRIAAGLPGVLFVVSGLRWIFDAEAAAHSLGMPLLDGIGRSTQVGDMAAFFLAMGTMILLGVIRLERLWLQAAIGLIGGAAICRTLAFLVAGAAFATQFIVIEVAVAALLFFAASRIDTPGRPEPQT